MKGKRLGEEEEDKWTLSKIQLMNQISYPSVLQQE